MSRFLNNESFEAETRRQAEELEGYEEFGPPIDGDGDKHDGLGPRTCWLMSRAPDPSPSKTGGAHESSHRTDDGTLAR